ncbi:MAG TPA: hypothetical protein VK504_24695 [Vicinamibacterales bacterium]|jgi:hypothetical protein|nr:hypothetical protein [Vicinamibacterales bacterium]
MTKLQAGMHAGDLPTSAVDRSAPTSKDVALALRRVPLPAFTIGL